MFSYMSKSTPKSKSNHMPNHMSNRIPTAIVSLLPTLHTVFMCQLDNIYVQVMEYLCAI